MLCSGWLIIPVLASNHDPPDLYFLDRLAGVRHWSRAPFPILKISGDGTVHQLTSTIKTLPKKDKEQTTKYASIAQDILSFTYSIAEPWMKSNTNEL
jgi:hypothetical protein